MIDCQAKILVTADGAWRGEKLLHLKEICDTALEVVAKNHQIAACIVVAHMNRVTPGEKGYENNLQVNIYFKKLIRLIKGIKNIIIIDTLDRRS